MKTIKKRIVSFFLTFILLFSFINVPMYARDDESVIFTVTDASRPLVVTALYQDKSITMVEGESLTLSFEVKSVERFKWLKFKILKLVANHGESNVMFADQKVTEKYEYYYEGNTRLSKVVSSTISCTVTAYTAGDSIIAPYLWFEATTEQPYNQVSYANYEISRYYIKIIPNDFHIDFDSVGGNDINSKSVKWDKTIGTLPTPVKDGFTFDGWYTDIEGGEKITSTLKYNYKEDITLYAHWSPNSYTISFDGNGGTIDQTEKQVVYNEKYGELPTPVWKNHTFLGWYTERESGEKITSNSIYTNDSVDTLYAHWSPNSYTISFDGNGGTVDQTEKEVMHNEKYGELPTPVWEHHTFLGWYTERESGEKITSNSIYTNDSVDTLYAHWKEEYTPVTRIVISDEEITVKAGEWFKINAHVLPENATNQEILFSIYDSSDSGVLSFGEISNDGGVDFASETIPSSIDGVDEPTVSSNNTNEISILAVKPGTGIIEACSMDNGMIATCVVTVIANEPPHVHEYVKTESTTPTCVTNGHNTYTCSCGDSYIESVPPTGEHNWEDWYTLDPVGCENDGTEGRACYRCEKYETRVVPATGHSMSEWTLMLDPNCTQEGREERWCTNCYEFTESRSVPVTNNHNWTPWYTSKSPDFGIEGENRRDCYRCGEFEIETIPPLEVPDENAPQIIVSNVNGHTGDTVTVTVDLKNNPGFAGMNAYLTYSDGLILREVQNSTHLTFTNDVTMVWDGISDYTGDSELLKLTFDISESAEIGEHFVKVNFIEAYTSELDNVTFTPVTGYVNVVDYDYGDANGDGEINTKDIILIRRYVAAKDPITGISTIEVSTGADANGDGEINTKDIILVRRYVAAKDPTTGESSVVLGPTE